MREICLYGLIKKLQKNLGLNIGVVNMGYDAFTKKYDQLMSGKVVSLSETRVWDILTHLDYYKINTLMVQDDSEKENIATVLSGTVVYVNYEISNTYTIIVQHGNYMSVYRDVEKPLKRIGDAVQAGESLAIAGKRLVIFELWRDGISINPEEVIAF